MTKFLNTVNFLLALGLGVVCLVQWRREHDYHQEIIKLDKTRQEQLIKIDENERQIRGYQEDIAGFKERVTKMQASLEEQEALITSNHNQIVRLEAATNQLGVAVEAWKKGVADRDEAIKKQNETITKVATERDGLVKKFNELAKQHNEVVEKYNDVVNQINAERAAQGKSQPQPDQKKKEANK